MAFDSIIIYILCFILGIVLSGLFGNKKKELGRLIVNTSDPNKDYYIIELNSYDILDKLDDNDCVVLKVRIEGSNTQK